MPEPHSKNEISSRALADVEMKKCICGGVTFACFIAPHKDCSPEREVDIMDSL